MKLWKTINPSNEESGEQAREFIAHTEATYKAGGQINGVWHPVCQITALIRNIIELSGRPNDVVDQFAVASALLDIAAREYEAAHKGEIDVIPSPAPEGDVA